MKCIRCQKDCKLDERKDRRCPHCGGRFALEPRGTDTLTDGLFDSAVKAVSADGKVRWHLENLYFEVCRRKPVRVINAAGALRSGLTGCSGCGGIYALLLLFTGDLGGLALGGLALGGAVLRRSMGPAPATTPRLFSRETFNSEWSRWAEVHGTPASMIAASTRRPKNAKGAVEADLSDYSFDRAVICDLPQTADLLLANNFHFENNCAVLTKDGYPQQAFEPVKSMLRRNPRLKVWVLHDATIEGCLLAHQLKHDPDWFIDSATIIDVGLRPANAKALQKVWEASTREVVAHPALSEQERQWLEKYTLSLAAIRPEQVIKRLFRSMSMEESSWSDSGGLFFVDSTSFSSDADTTDGGGDSFG
jgi:DNA-directed RNA polymerase subunit RPC12/RpoP